MAHCPTTSLTTFRFLVRFASSTALRHLTWGLVIAVITYVNTGQSVLAQQDVFEASLRAGEFTTAVRLANAQSEPRQRATQLRQIASLQATLGERGAMVHTLAQQQGFQGGLQGLGQGSGQGNQNGIAGGGAGGGTQADFDPLIELITSTIEPDTWTEVGGPGAIDAFAGGVFVDMDGLMQRTTSSKTVVARPARTNQPKLGSEWQSSEQNEGGSTIKAISLPRLERAIQRELALGRPIPQHMRWLGIKHIAYVVAYPESADLVIAGPAVTDAEINRGQSGISLSDLLVVWQALRSGAAEFGCSIDPVPQNLATAQRYLDATSGIAIKPTQRTRWLHGLREAVGEQNVRVFGVDVDSTTARTMVEADYHMKLVGIGLEPAPPGIVNYLQSVKLGADGSLPPLEVLRWWFTLGDSPIEAMDDQLTFMLPEQTVKVLSENELVDLQGARQATGASSPSNSAFAASFSEHFLDLAETYPIYAKLRTIFDLAFALATIEAHDLAGQVQWQPTLFIDQEKAIQYGLVESARNARRVDTVINHRVIARKHIVAAVSGGVVVKPTASSIRYTSARDPQALDAMRARVVPNEDHVLWSWRK